MKSREVWEITPDEIGGKLHDAYAELFNLRFQFATASCRTARLGQVRRILPVYRRFRAKQVQKQQGQGYNEGRQKGPGVACYRTG
jgi:ribosomal protein L29